jgi:transcriptional regulator of met regulon
MKNIDKLNNLLVNTQTLVNLLNEHKNTNEYTISFFSQAFETAHHLLVELHALEAEQMEQFSKQLEAHQLILNSLTQHVQKEETPQKENPLLNETPPIETDVETIQTNAATTATTQIETTETVQTTKTLEVIETTQAAEVVETIKVIETTETTEQLKTAETVKVSELIFENVVHNFVDKPVHKPVDNSVDNDTIKAIDQSIDQLVHNAVHKPVDNSVHNSVDKPVYNPNRPDFKKAFTLNDLFLFRRELFKGDNTLMNNTIEHLNQIQTLNESLTYLQCEFCFDFESQTVKSFVTLLEKRFA